jgi:hypothetical protein
MPHDDERSMPTDIAMPFEDGWSVDDCLAALECAASNASAGEGGE